MHSIASERAPRSRLRGAILGGALVMGATSPARAQTLAQCADDAAQGQAARDAGRLLESRKLFIECTSSACPSVIRTDCAKWHGELEPRIPTMAVRAQVAGLDVVDATVSVDGADVPIGRSALFDPGRHTIVVRRGDREVSRELVLAEGELGRVVVVELPAAATPAAARADTVTPEADDRGGALRAIGLVTGAAGVVGLGIGTFFGVRAIAKNDDSNADGHCDASGCDPAGAQARNDALGAATASTVSFAAGGVLLASGAALFLLSPRGGAQAARSGARDRSTASPALGALPGGGVVSVQGTW